MSEYRRSRLTALKLGTFMQSVAAILQHVHREALGSELLAEEEH
jgi:hypothetical protein